ncbi:MAG: VOC family protein [Leptolyngbya sp. SIO1E4]|nr:VOC family protein [Leptolyngbya sp. SIO1E4]
MAIARLIPNICSQRLVESRDFYVNLLGFEVAFDSDWYVQVASPTNPRLELGIIQQDNELVPPSFQAAPRGQYLTLVVEDVDAVYAKAQAMNLAVLQPPKDEFYGQRRMLVTDPNGLLLDISTPIAS